MGEKCLRDLRTLGKPGEICTLVYYSFYLYGRNMSPCQFLSTMKTGEICPDVGYA